MGLLMRRHRQPPQAHKEGQAVIEQMDYVAMKKDELLAIAKEKGIEVPVGATKKDLLILLEV